VIDQQVGEGDTVVTRWTAFATHRGSLHGIPASNRPVVVKGMLMSRFEDGMWAEDHVVWDTLGLLTQIGAIPAGAPA
jgi:predicted ester cyclase